MKDCAMLILAGGKSKRMGSDKAGLKLGDQSFLEILIEKGRKMNVSELYVSGRNAGDVFHKGIESVEDIYPERGPLGGMHACFLRMKSPVSWVISVDVPQIPVWILQGLMEAHSRRPDQVKATILRHHNTREPLIGVYDTDCAAVIEECIREKGCPVFRVLERIGWQEYEWEDEEKVLEEWMVQNLNTPVEYEALCARLKEK